jgi:hypothetical protein
VYFFHRIAAKNTAKSISSSHETMRGVAWKSRGLLPEFAGLVEGGLEFVWFEWSAADN